MKISRKRAPLALATMALATALAALPATASADDKDATYYDYGPGPAIDGQFNDWAGIPEIGSLQNAAPNQGHIKAHYNCSTGRLSVNVYGLGNDNSEAQSQIVAPPNGPANYVTVYDEKDAVVGTYTRGNSDALPGPGGFEMRFGLAPGKYKLLYHAESGGMPPVTASGVGPVPPPNGDSTVIGGYAHVYLHCPVLRPEKTAEGRYSHLYDWSVKKTATVDQKNSKAPTVTYKVDVNKMGPRTIDRDVVGTIKVHNPYRIAVPRVLIGDKGVHGTRSECKITSAKLYDPNTKTDRPVRYERDASYVPFLGIPSGWTAYVGYICHPHPEVPVSKLPKKPENVGYVKFPHPNGERPRPELENGAVTVLGRPAYAIHTEYVKTPFSFSTLNQSYFNNVKVFDTYGKNTTKLGLLNESGSYSYDRKLAPPKEGCKVYTNTAKLVNHGAPEWGPTSTSYVKICRNKDGSVSTHATNPKKPSTDKDHGPKVCHVNLRTSIRGASRIGPRGRVFTLTIANRGKLAAGYVKSKFSVSKGLRVRGVRGVPRRAFRIRGKHVYMHHKWIPRGQARKIQVLVVPRRNIRRQVERLRVRRGHLKLVSRHRCDVSRSGKRVLWINNLPNREEEPNEA